MLLEPQKKITPLKGDLKSQNHAIPILCSPALARFLAGLFSETIRPVSTYRIVRTRIILDFPSSSRDVQGTLTLMPLIMPGLLPVLRVTHGRGNTGLRTTFNGEGIRAKSKTIKTNKKLSQRHRNFAVNMDGGAFGALTPKDETQAARFVRETGADGRGVVVAILDTGIDPGSSGLYLTPDGRPKIVDMIECSGSGDVDTSTQRQKSPSGTLLGLSGRLLTLNPAWNNPTGIFRVGIKAAWELYPTSLRQRLKKERAALLSRETAPLAASLRCSTLSGGLATAEADKLTTAFKDLIGVSGLFVADLCTHT